MTRLKIIAGAFEFDARFESAAPQTCARFAELLPFESKVIHVRWSGEAVWVPFGERRLDLPYENHTSHPAPGHVILYPGGISEMELLIAYGGVSFSSKVGQLAGNHFMTLTSGLDNLPELGRRTLWEGAQELRIVAASGA